MCDALLLAFWQVQRRRCNVATLVAEATAKMQRAIANGIEQSVGRQEFLVRSSSAIGIDSLSRKSELPHARP
jgi:hypothetical protein